MGRGFMPALYDLLRQLRRLLNRFSDHETGSLDLVLIEQVQRTRDTLIVSVGEEGVRGKIGETIFDGFGNWSTGAGDGLPAALEHKRNADCQPRSIRPEFF